MDYQKPKHTTHLGSPTLGFPEFPKKEPIAAGASPAQPAPVSPPRPHPPSGGPVLRVIPLGGLEEVGKNMTVFEFANDIIIVDMGFSFPDENMLGIDYVIPDVAYLEDKKDRIRGMIFTHGHLDHIGAIPYLLPKLNFPTIYTLPLTRGMIEKRLEEFGLKEKAHIVTVQASDVLRLGVFKIEMFRVNHNIPDGIGIAIHSPVGIMVHTGDFKFDHTPIGDIPADFGKIARIGAEGVLALFSDSTNAEIPGRSISESEVQKELDDIIKNAKGRVFAATFSTLVVRVQQFIWAAQKYGRQVAFLGRSMKENIEIARELKYLDVPKGIVVEEKEATRLPDDKILVLLTGSQGEERSALNRISRGEHKFFSIKKGDTVVLSSSPIPGNERSVTGMMDNLIRDGAKVIYKLILGVHTSGHANQEDLKLMMNLVKPKFLIPIHGERHMLAAHAELGIAVGIPEENIFTLDNGQVLEFAEGGVGRLTEEKIAVGLIMVDGLGVGDVGNVVIRDRQKMAEEGMFVVITTVDSKNGKLVSSPDIISRGFIYMRESTELVNEARQLVRKILSEKKGQQEHPASWDYIKQKIRDDVGEFLFEKTQRRPLVLPVVIEV